MFDFFQNAYNALSPSTQTVLIVCLIVGGIALAVCLVLKLFKIAVGVVLLMILVPNLFTIFFGNGTDTVKNISQYFDSDTGQQITESYDYFKKKDKELGGVNTEKVKETWNSAVTVK